MEERGEKKTQDSPQLTLSAARLFSRGRCGQCLPCRQVKHKQACVRSLSRRGHQGALLTLLGASAIGVRVEVHWELDAAWYAGAVTAYDVHTSKHTLHYDLDGEEETIPLWQQKGVRVLDPLRGAEEGKGEEKEEKDEKEAEKDVAADVSPSAPAVAGQDANEMGLELPTPIKTPAPLPPDDTPLEQLRSLLSEASASSASVQEDLASSRSKVETSLARSQAAAAALEMAEAKERALSAAAAAFSESEARLRAMVRRATKAQEQAEKQREVAQLFEMANAKAAEAAAALERARARQREFEIGDVSAEEDGDENSTGTVPMDQV